MKRKVYSIMVLVFFTGSVILGSVGSLVQFKEIFGVGFSYKF